MINKQVCIRFSSLMLAFFLVFGSFSADAQSRSKSKKDKDKKEDSLKDHLWYGGSVNIGFSGYNGYNTFIFGVAPMAGYKLTDWFSIGPRLGADYIFQKIPCGGVNYNANLFRFEPGLFARAKIYRGVFAHAEQSIAFEQRATCQFDGKVLKESYRYNNTYLGLGLNQSSGNFGYDVYILYNFELASVNTSQLPFVYRFGFTYKF